MKVSIWTLSIPMSSSLITLIMVPNHPRRRDVPIIVPLRRRDVPIIVPLRANTIIISPRNIITATPTGRDIVHLITDPLPLTDRRVRQITDRRVRQITDRRVRQITDRHVRLPLHAHPLQVVEHRSAARLHPSVVPLHL